MERIAGRNRCFIKLASNAEAFLQLIKEGSPPNFAVLLRWVGLFSEVLNEIAHIFFKSGNVGLGCRWHFRVASEQRSRATPRTGKAQRVRSGSAPECRSLLGMGR